MVDAGDVDDAAFSYALTLRVSPHGAGTCDGSGEIDATEAKKGNVVSVGDGVRNKGRGHCILQVRAETSLFFANNTSPRP